MNKLIILFGALFIIFIIGCEIQKDIVEPIEPVLIPEPILLSEQEQCEQEGKLWFYSTLQEASCIEKNSEIIQCEEVGGKWKMFSNGCVDNCGQKPRICTTVLTEGCDCGATKCYGVEDSITSIEPSCIDDPFEPYATEQEACEKTGGEWMLSCPPSECEIVNEIKICTDFICIPPKCICPEGEIFTPFKGCIPKKQLEGLLSIISYG